MSFLKKIIKSFPKKNDANDYVYESIIFKLQKSKYCKVIEDEKVFVKALLSKLRNENLPIKVKLERTSRKDIHFFYNSYPIGRVKLNGRKRWMTVNTANVQQFDGLDLDEFVDKIDTWISYIRQCERS